MSVASLREMGYTVIHASNSASALRKLGAHPETALLFTDIVMPEMNGRQLAIETLNRRPELKIYTRRDLRVTPSSIAGSWTRAFTSSQNLLHMGNSPGRYVTYWVEHFI